MSRLSSRKNERMNVQSVCDQMYRKVNPLFRYDRVREFDPAISLQSPARSIVTHKTRPEMRRIN
jgi:hypothetical protein